MADECGEDYMQVTYYLAIAKIALQIKNTDKGLLLIDYYLSQIIHGI